jgi:hypothetical protein
MSRKNEELEKLEQRQEDQAEIRLIQYSANELPRSKQQGIRTRHDRDGGGVMR